MRILDPAPREVWDQVAVESPDATFFHTRTWAEVLCSTYPDANIATRAYVLDDGKLAVLPLLRRSGGLKGVFTSLESMTPGVYGGVISTGRISPADAAAIYSGLHGWRTASFDLTGNPFSNVAPPDAADNTPMVTHFLPLRDGIDALWRQFSKGHKSATRKAEREGVQLRMASTQADIQAYYVCYRNAHNKWGETATSDYGYELFLNIWQLCKDAARFWCADFKGEIIAGALVFYHNRHAVNWHSGSLSEHLHLAPNNFLLWHAIQDAAARGFEWFDFNPSGGHVGVDAFKRSFGSQPLHFKRYAFRRKSGVFGAYSRVRELLKLGRSPSPTSDRR